MKKLFLALVLLCGAVCAFGATVPKFTGQFVGNGVGLTNVTSTTNVIYVELTGSDLTGDGSYAHPWKTLMRACSCTNASNLDGLTIKLGPGRFDYVGPDAFACELGALYDGVKVPFNGALIGAGKELTFITSSNCFDAFSLVQMQENSTLANLTVDTWNVDPGNVLPVGNAVSDTTANMLNPVLATNIFLRNVRIYGGADCFINSSGGTITNAVFENCEFYSHFDGVTLRCAGTGQPGVYNFYNCIFWTDGAGGETCLLGPQDSSVQTWNLYGGSATIPAGNPINTVFQLGGAGSVMNLYNVVVSTPSMTNVFQGASAAHTFNVYGGNGADCQPRADFAGTLNVFPKRLLVQQVDLDGNWTNLIPKSTATVTNWWLGCTNNGIPILVATNFNNTPAGQAFFVKVLVP